MRLKELRKTKGVSQDEVAKALNISLRAYQNYEYSSREPNIEMLIKLADYYGVTIDELVGREVPDKYSDLVKVLANRYNLNQREQAFFRAYLDTPVEQRAGFLATLSNMNKYSNNST